jgi:hypothetical protein
MIRITEKSCFSALLFLFALVILITTFGMRSDIVLVPRFACTGLLLLSGIQLLTDLFPVLQRKLPSFNKSAEAASITGEGVVDATVETKEEAVRRYILIAWMILFILLIYYTSIIIAIPISTFICLRWISKQSWRMSLIYSVVMALSVYLIFVVGFSMHYFM